MIANATTPTARERLLAAADELFYEEGIHTVGIDRVIERAGVAKATLYSTFGSKDALVRAYLLGRFESRKGRVQRKFATLSTPREKMLGVYDVLADLYAEDDFHGCAFMNASAESPSGGTVEAVSDESRAWTNALFADLALEAGVTEPERLARQLVLLYDGAIISARMDRDGEAITAAKATAAAIIDAAPRRS